MILHQNFMDTYSEQYEFNSMLFSFIFWFTISIHIFTLLLSQFLTIPVYLNVIAPTVCFLSFLTFSSPLAFFFTRPQACATPCNYQCT